MSILQPDRSLWPSTAADWRKRSFDEQFTRQRLCSQAAQLHKTAAFRRTEPFRRPAGVGPMFEASGFFARKNVAALVSYSEGHPFWSGLMR